MPVYPEKIQRLIAAAALRKNVSESNATGRAATFLCGVSVSFELSVDEASQTIRQAGFKTNGCGYAAAAAESLSSGIEEVQLVDLDGLLSIKENLDKEIGKAPEEREHCYHICLDALQDALAEYRKQRVSEWNGEEALICSCFGIAESEIETAISKNGLSSVDDVGEVCHAGTGCGSCQPLIQEILDTAKS